jgi:hypothetical protein
LSDQLIASVFAAEALTPKNLDLLQVEKILFG